MTNEKTIDGITVGGQPTAEELLSGRFATVVNLRLPGEPGNDTAATLAGHAEVTYAAVPWNVDTVTRGDIERVREAVDASSGPVLIHCMAATRAALAAGIVSAEKDGSGAEGARAKIAGAGFDIGGTGYDAFVTSYFAKP